MSDFYYLSHGGPGSGRYPLGSGERPYQKYEGSGGRGIGRLSGYIRSVREKHAEKQQQKTRNEKLRKALEEEQLERQKEIDKERVLRSGTATEVLKYQGELSNQEMQNVINRLSLESQLRSYSAKDMKTAVDKFDDLMKNVKTVNDWVKIGTDSYNSLARIYNATSEGRENPLGIVDTGGGSGGGGKKKRNQRSN